jgi:hypothetical protein
MPIIKSTVSAKAKDNFSILVPEAEPVEAGHAVCYSGFDRLSLRKDSGH